MHLIPIQNGQQIFSTSTVPVRCQLAKVFNWSKLFMIKRVSGVIVKSDAAFIEIYDNNIVIVNVIEHVEV